MKRVFSLLVITAALAAPTFAARRIVPLAGHVRGVNNTFWTTELQLSNTTAEFQNVHLTFHPTGGSPVSRDIALAANESVLVRDVTSPASFGAPASTEWLGELELESSGDFSATARTFTSADDESGTYGSVSDSVDPSLLSKSGTIGGLAADDRFRTNLALTNANDDVVTMHLEVRRRDGSLIASDDLALQPHQTRQISASQYAKPEDSPFAVRWSASDRAYMVASTVDNRSGDPTESQSIGAPSASLFFPLVGKTPGANGTFWTTSLSIANTEDRAANATIDFRGNDGSHVSKSVRSERLGLFQSDDVFQLLGLPSGSGSLTIESEVKVTSAARVFNTREDGATFGSSLLPQEHASRSALAHVRGVRRDDDFRLNVAISDDNIADADGVIRFFDERHSEVESQRFHVPAHTTLQFAINQTSRAVGSGEIEVETEHGIEVSVTASNIDNHSGDTVAREPEQQNERQQELEIVMSSRTAAVGSPVTFNAVVTGLQVSSYQWDFGDGKSGSGQSVTHAFQSGGEFEVTLLVTLASGAQLRKAEDITITGGTGGGGGATSFDFTFSPQSPSPGQPVTFTATIGGTAKPGAFVKWQIGTQRLTGASITFTFAAAGNYEVEAELEQEGALTLKATHTVSVGGTVPNPGGSGATAIDFTWSPSSPRAGQSVSFNASITGTPLAGSEIKWKFPDSSRPTGANTYFTFAAAGTYKVSVEISQPGRASIQREKNVTVAP